MEGAGSLHSATRGQVNCREFSGGLHQSRGGSVGHTRRASRAAAGLLERTRCAGKAIVQGARTAASLGVDAPRILQTAGTLITHRNPTPEDVISLAGTDWPWEDKHSVSGLGLRQVKAGRPQ